MRCGPVATPRSSVVWADGCSHRAETVAPCRVARPRAPNMGEETRSIVETALHAHLAARGAVHADDRGIALPRHFGDPEAEYTALTRGAAVLDLGFRTLTCATGPDRVTFLQGMLS